MLEFLFFLLFGAVFASPLIVRLYQAFVKKNVRDDEEGVTASQWKFAGAWAGLGLLLLIAFFYVMSFYVHYLWFAELRAPGRYLTEYKAYWILFALGGFATFFFLELNVRKVENAILLLQRPDRPKLTWFPPVASAVGVLMSLVMALWVGSYWFDFLSF